MKKTCMLTGILMIVVLFLAGCASTLPQHEPSAFQENEKAKEPDAYERMQRLIGPEGIYMPPRD